MSFSPALPMSFAHERYLGRPACPCCGEVAIAAEATVYSEDGRVRHSWSCDACQATFDTVVDFRAWASGYGES